MNNKEKLYIYFYEVQIVNLHVPCTVYNENILEKIIHFTFDLNWIKMFKSFYLIYKLVI